MGEIDGGNRAEGAKIFGSTFLAFLTLFRGSFSYTFLKKKTLDGIKKVQDAFRELFHSGWNQKSQTYFP